MMNISLDLNVHNVFRFNHHSINYLIQSTILRYSTFAFDQKFTARSFGHTFANEF